MDQLSTTELGLPAPRHPDEAEGELSGCRLRLKLDSQVVAWEEELTGTLFIEGGFQAYTVSVEIRFAAYPGQWSSCIHVPPRNWKAIQIQPHERVRVCFKLRMPRWVGFGPVQCQALVRAEGRRSTTLIGGITVAPPLSYQHLALLLGEVTGARIQSWQRHEEDTVDAIFTFAGSSPWPFDRLALLLRRNNGIAHGRLLIQPPISWRDVDSTDPEWEKTRRFSFDFPEKKVHLARSFYEKSLQAYQVAICQLPIPATGLETAADQLPVPVHQGGRAECLKSE